MSLIKVEPSGLHEESIEEEERPVAGGRPEQSGDEMKQEQPAAPKETSEPDIPSFRYVERGARMYNVPLAIYHSPRNTCASHRYMYHLCTGWSIWSDSWVGLTSILFVPPSAWFCLG